MGKVLILGGYGNFGKRIAIALAKKGVIVIIAGRSKEKAEAFANTLEGAESAIFDVTVDLDTQLDKLRPAVVINTCGPFQNSNYDVVKTCIKHCVHYIDLADGRNFVTGIAILDYDARQNNVAVISGASTVPCLSSAVIERFKSEFSEIESMLFGISPGQNSGRGLATTQGIMSYVGKPLKPVSGNSRISYGWQDIYIQSYPEIGSRWMANCDIPDLDLLPTLYGIRSIRFSAGLELWFMHFGLWFLSWIVRIGFPINLVNYANTLLKISDLFNWFGTADGGMHLILHGKDMDGKSHERRWFIIAKNGDGQQIPTIPAIVLAEKLSTNCLKYRGATACVGMLTLEEYLEELKDFSITTYEN